MAKIGKNLATKGFRGMIGGTLVFRQYGSGTVVSAAPVSSSKEPSEKQLAQREKWRLANYYARRVKTDVNLLAIYQEGALNRGYSNVHAFIIADYFRLPKILSYSREVDETTSEARIVVFVVDLIAAKSVTLQIQTPDGTTLESGSATVEADGQGWIYNPADQANLATGNQLVVEVTDHPGHVVTQSFVL